MADEEWARGVHPSADRCTELTEAEITEVLQLASGGFPDDGERHRGPLQSVLASASVLSEKRLSKPWRRGPASD